MAGNEITAKRATAFQAGTCEPVTALRALATRLDNPATRAGSCPAERTADRCVAVRWYRVTSSSTSAPVSARRRLTNVSSRFQSGWCAATKASTSTSGDYCARPG